MPSFHEYTIAGTPLRSHAVEYRINAPSRAVPTNYTTIRTAAAYGSVGAQSDIPRSREMHFQQQRVDGPEVITNERNRVTDPHLFSTFCSLRQVWQQHADQTVWFSSLKHYASLPRLVYHALTWTEIYKCSWFDTLLIRRHRWMAVPFMASSVNLASVTNASSEDESKLLQNRARTCDDKFRLAYRMR